MDFDKDFDGISHPAIKTLLATGAALSAGEMSLDIDGTPAHLVPAGWRLELHEDARESPRRVESAATLNTLDSFIGYLMHHANSGSAVFVDATPTATTFYAIIDYHEAALPGWCKFRAVYNCPKTPDFADWLAHSGKEKSQTEFAEFIEDHLPDIVDPAAAEVAEIARSLQANINVKFAKAVRLDNGESQLQYVEEINGTAGAKGQLKIPQTIKLGLRLFPGGDPYAIEARFKYRIREGVLRMWYELVRPHRMIEDAVTQMVDSVRQQLPEVKVYEGKP